MAMRAVFNSWNTDRARIYRRRERIPQDLGTAVNVCAMVFGNLGETSGTGVCFTRDPATGKQGVYGDYLPNAQGEDVVAGIRNTLSLEDFARLDPSSHGELTRIMRRLETHYRDLCDIEFTVERGKLWMLQTRVGKRTAAAAFRIATQLVDERLITQDEALHRVTGHQLSQLMFPQFDPDAERSLLTKGMAASPGAAVGEVVFDSATAVARAAAGQVGAPGAPRDDARRPGGDDRRRRACSPAGAARPATPPSSPGAWAAPACAGRRRSTSTPRPAPRGCRTSPSTRATCSRSTARPARSSSASCRSSPRPW